MTGTWLGLAARGRCGVLGSGRSVLAIYPATAQARTIGSQMYSGSLRLNSEEMRLIRAFRERNPQSF